MLPGGPDEDSAAPAGGAGPGPPKDAGSAAGAGRADGADAEPRPPAAGRYAAAGSVEVLAKHATQDVRIRVVLPRNARFRHVRQAIAKCLGSDEILGRGALTGKVKGVYKAYKDKAPVGDTREVTVAGADFGSGGDADLEVTLDAAEIAADTEEALETGSGSGQQISHLPLRAPPMPPHAASRAAKAGSKPWIKGSRLTKRQALSLQRELYEGFKADDFQQELGRLVERYGASQSSAEFQQERQELFLSVQSSVLPGYGFEGTVSGVHRMMGAMGPFLEDPEFKQLATDINGLLGISSPPETWGSLSRSCRKLEPPGSRKGGDRPSGQQPPSVLRLAPLAVHSGAPPPQPPPPGPRAPAPPRFDRWPIGKYQPFKLFVAGTWNDFRPAEMHWQNGLFVSPVTVGSNGWESFQILKNGDWGATIYPSVPDAGPFEEHTVCGPDSRGHGKNWQIGRYVEEEAIPGTQFAVVATVDKEGCVKLVHWEHLA